ncbi:MAG: hypothetical protein KDC83_00495 [Flavobacteriales bacterium]|nr:hypothetical protein [Flavobacteriales bacterium]
MKKYLLIALCASFFIHAHAQEELDFSIRGTGAYQFFSFSGMRTNSSTFGINAEKRIRFSSTFGINFQYMSRFDDAADQKRNEPHFNEVFHFTPYFRQYFDKSFKGPYTGIGLGIGIPKDVGVQTELGGHFGYVIQQGSVVIDLGIQTGFGAFRYNEEKYGAFGQYLGSAFYADYGFFFRPTLGIGFGK